MSDRTITLHEYYAPSDHLPDGWKIVLVARNSEAYMELEDPDGNDVAFDFGDTTVWSVRNAVDVAREREGLPPVDWYGEPTDESDTDR